MKKTLLLITLLAISKITFCQSQSDFNYSIGISALTIQEYPKLLNEVRNGNIFYTSGFNGITAKVNDNQISYRFQVSNVKEDNYSFKNECENCEVVIGDYKSFDLKMGFERSLIYSKIQPFYGIDLGYKRANFDGKSNNANNNTFLYNANIEKNGGLIYPFLGVKYNVIPAITISAETGIDFIYTHDKEIKSDNTNAPTSVNNFSRWQFNTKPLGLLSLQFNFGRD
ncbi:hypothetical protein A5893_06480 [Pedobacter psychrophilus]|uniref:Outer membrane protein beta-barrel domain-containing protein n=1 Tax=Pedobacter psychrophilus TaxID=1826909 RepID=A0A179DHN5_9SPHI|nr:hypothetical protein [Pedobacter psychrophilus]OAQ40586.1 hypothetical protein A5893_06480 [Pedobacter psychrophilus]